MNPIKRFKEIQRRYEKLLSVRLREMGDIDVVDDWFLEYERELNATLAVFDRIERSKDEVVDSVDVADEVTMIVQNELFPYALAYWTLLYCEKTKTL